MMFELGTYGLTSGLLYKILPKNKGNIYLSLICSMIIGRIIWGVSRVVLLSLGNYEFSWTAFIAGAFLNAIPGIIVQLVLIPILIIAIENLYFEKNFFEVADSSKWH